VEAHVEPALGLAQVVVAHQPALVVEALDAALQRLVRLLVGRDGGIADALGSRLQLRGLRLRGQGQHPGQREGRGGGE
jgi:hypothetical protein